VEARFLCSDIVGQLRSGDYTVPEGASISDLLEISRAECPDKVPDERVDYLIFLQNGKSAQLTAKLAPGDKIHVLRKIIGG